MIPKLIHQIWIQGEKNIPESLLELHNNCKRINNNFKYIIWDEISIRKLLKDNFEKKYLELYDSYTIFAQKADFARYVILYFYGGIYLDMDMSCRKNLEDFLSNHMFFTTYRLPKIFKRYLNGIVGAKTKHPAFRYVFDTIFERKNKNMNVTNSTGTGMFYCAITKYMKNNPNVNDVTIVDYKYLDPCHAFSGEECHEKCDDCYVVHTSYSSWSPSIRIGKNIVKHKYLILLILIIAIILFIYLK